MPTTCPHSYICMAVDWLLKKSSKFLHGPLTTGYIKTHLTSLSHYPKLPTTQLPHHRLPAPTHSHGTAAQPSAASYTGWDHVCHLDTHHRSGTHTNSTMEGQLTKAYTSSSYYFILHAMLHLFHACQADACSISHLATVSTYVHAD